MSDVIRDDDFKSFRRQSVRIAKDFSYGKAVVSAIEKAESIAEINRILHTARDNKFGQ